MHIQSMTPMTFNGFVRLLTHPTSAVILHLPNHYALVFGVRIPERLVLTARKGQSPNNWVPWDELLETQKKCKEGLVIAVQKQK